MTIQLVAFAVTFATAFAATAQDWKQRSIYQLLTDRFAPSTDSSAACDNLQGYCGGTFQGIENHLDYIQELGFDAIWISPVVTNTDNGYHGYWAKDFYTINSNYGTEDDLVSLASALHAKDMYLMIDVVANHVGNPAGNDFNQINPFNQAAHYHDCNQCPSSCNIQDFTNPTQTRLCRLAGLPDLNQSNSFVGDALVSWIADYVVGKWQADGIRIDTVPEVNTDFWSSFQKSAGVYAVGEVFNGDPAYVGPFQGPLNAVLSYPMYFTIRSVFGQGQGMQQIDSQFGNMKQHFQDVSVLGTFVDNHDNDRFLCDYRAGNANQRKYINALTFALTFTGIPITYYGSEQGFVGANNGCSDPDNRQAMWTTGFNANGTDIAQAVSAVNSARKMAKIWNYDFTTKASNNNYYAFTRGPNFLVALTNVGYSGGQISFSVDNSGLTSGTEYCNIFYPTADCFKYQGGSVNVNLDSGECKVYVPSGMISEKHLFQNVFHHAAV